jgi:energy-coupling factor transporter ATP-binding protein EcfA2
VILAAHRLSSIARAERVVVIENGVVSEEGPYELLVSPSCLALSGAVPPTHPSDLPGSETSPRVV